MKFFNWMQSKFNGAQNVIPASNHAKKEPPKEEFSDWPHGLLAIGTFGNTNPRDEKQEIQVDQNSNSNSNKIPPNEEECSSPDFSEFTAEEVVKLKKELKKLLTKKPADESVAADLPLDRFLNCPSSLEVDRNSSSRFSTYSDDKDEEEIDRTIRIILGRCKDVCEKKKKNKTIGIKSLSFLVKKMFVCRSGFAPAPSLRDSLHESRMEKLLRTMLTKKIYTQKNSRTSVTKKYLEDYRPSTTTADKQEEEESHDRSQGGSKWDKTDSEFIVLEI